MLTPADIQAVSDGFGLGRAGSLRGPAARGEVGQVWRLETTRGTFALKESFEPATETELAEGAAFQEAAAAAGVPCPAIVRRSDSSLLLDLDGGQVRVFEWVDLLERDTRLDPALVGVFLAALHQVPFTGTEPVDPWYVEPVGDARWEEIAIVLEERGAPFAEQLEGLRDELYALEALIVPPGDLRTCHRDLWADNLRGTPSGDLCLVDWDDAGLADPSQELALVAFEFCREDPRRARTLLDAYVEAGGPGRLRSVHDFSMPIAQLGHIGERTCRLWLEASDNVGKERAAKLFAEFADEALTRAAIDDLLLAVTR